MAHRNPGDRDFAPELRRTNPSADLSGKLNPRPLAKSKPADVFVEFLIADAKCEFGRSDVARFHQNVFHAQIREWPMIVQRRSAKIPDAVFTKDHGIRAHLFFIERRRGRHNLKSGTRLHHVDDGAVFHLFRFGLRAQV